MGTDAETIDCPRAKSQTTPCYLRDGEMVVVESRYFGRICVGCERRIAVIERADHDPQEEADDG